MTTDTELAALFGIETSPIDDLAADIRVCVKCDLSASRRNAVPGDGPEHAPVMLVAEKPGVKEDRTGRPMVGDAGLFFAGVLKEVGLDRRLFFITNAVKCMPPYKARLTVLQIEACEPWLDRQIELVDPKILVLCGNTAISRWFPGERIGEVHGTPRRLWDRIVIPTYHPAAAMHQDDLRAVLVRDFEVVARLVEDIVT